MIIKVVSLVLGTVTMNEPFSLRREGRKRSCEKNKRNFIWKGECDYTGILRWNDKKSKYFM